MISPFTAIYRQDWIMHQLITTGNVRLPMALNNEILYSLSCETQEMLAFYISIALMSNEAFNWVRVTYKSDSCSNLDRI